jgi:hypothetical protein
VRVAVEEKALASGQSIGTDLSAGVVREDGVFRRAVGGAATIDLSAMHLWYGHRS